MWPPRAQVRGGPRDREDARPLSSGCIRVSLHKKTATESVLEFGIKWLSCTARCRRSLGAHGVYMYRRTPWPTPRAVGRARAAGMLALPDISGRIWRSAQFWGFGLILAYTMYWAEQIPPEILSSVLLLWYKEPPACLSGAYPSRSGPPWMDQGSVRHRSLYGKSVPL